VLFDTPLAEEAFQEKAEAYVPALSSMIRTPIEQLAPLMKELVGDEVVRRITRPEDATFPSPEAKDRFVKGAHDLINPIQVLREVVQCTDPTHSIRQLAKLPDPFTDWFRDTLDTVQVNPALLSDILSAQEESQRRYRVAALSVLTRLAQVIWSVFGHRTTQLKELLLRSAKGDEQALYEYYSTLSEGRAEDLNPINVMKMPARCSDPTIHALLIFLAFGDQQRFCYQACPLLYQNTRCTNYSAQMILDLMGAAHGTIHLCLLSPSYVRQFGQLLKWASSTDQHTLEWAFPALASLNQAREMVLYVPDGHQFYQVPSSNDLVVMLHSVRNILRTYREEWFEKLERAWFRYGTKELRKATAPFWGALELTPEEAEKEIDIELAVPFHREKRPWNPFLPYFLPTSDLTYTPSPTATHISLTTEPEASTSSSTEQTSNKEEASTLTQQTSNKGESTASSRQQKRKVEEEKAPVLRRSKRQRNRK